MDDLKKIERSVVARAGRAKTRDDIAQLRAEVLGKKGSLSQVLAGLRDVPPTERPKLGQLVNQAKAKIEAALEAAEGRVVELMAAAELEKGRCDVTLPGRRLPLGAPHPLRLVEAEAIRVLIGLGFTVAEGPLVEHEWYNFEALNIPEDHSARDMHDTFFVANNVVLRTHTSPVQIRTMLKQKPPVRIIAPGMVFRHDDVDPTHSPVFHQIEGLWIDEVVTFADLRGVLHRFAEGMFGSGAEVRMRPSFFPFTEPSAEVDVSCFACKGSGGSCRVCKGTRWVEILGAGMVHPAVLEHVGYDPEQVQGFAFGAGIERIAMLRYGVDDLRQFYENDLRFLRQFGAKGATHGH